ncbi:nucleoside hydrolase [soil metagenome]
MSVVTIGRRLVAVVMACALFPAIAQTPASSAPASIPVIVDMDIGDDIDDAFALALLVNSPEFELLGITAAWGDTGLRGQLLDRFLRETGHADVPVGLGITTSNPTGFTQAAYARRGGRRENAASAVDLMLQAIRARPGQVTLIALAPLTDVAAAIERDPATFRQLKRIVMMGGSVRQGYGRSRYDAPRPPDAEYNIVQDARAAQRVFASGVPITMMPLDSTRIRFGEIERQVLFTRGSPTTDALGLLYLQWASAYQPWASQTPTLFDIVPVAALLDATLCPTTPLRIEVTAEGHTREIPGRSNADVCLASDQTRITDLMMQRLLGTTAAR